MSEYPQLARDVEKFHLYPEHGLLNDPNGLVFFKGYYHVFYQWNPTALNHGYKEWGHYRSRDLQTWEVLPSALVPSLPEDAAGIYSGTAVVLDDQLYLFYTGNVRDANGESIASHQMAAVSADGIHFEKLGELFEHPTGYTRHVRDPRVWQGRDGIWRLILGAQQADGLVGDIILYTSADLKNWHFVGSILGDQLRDVRGYMLECPDYLIVDGRGVLTFSPQGLAPQGEQYKNIYQTGYVLGRFDEESNQFLVETNFVEMDRGFEFYAPQVLQEDPRGRQLLFGWAGVMPEDREQALPTTADNRAHLLTMPRELHVVDNQLTQRPSNEMGAANLVQDSDTWRLPIGDHFLVEKQGPVLRLSRQPWEGGDLDTREVSGVTGPVHLYVDQSIVEIFANNGAIAMTARYF